MTKTLIILAGGASSRMKKSESTALSEGLTQQANTRSKALILLNDRPMLDYVLYNAKQAGINEIVIVIGRGDTLFREYYGTATEGNDFHGLSISYATQYIPEDRTKPFGTADAVLQALDQYPALQQQSFLVCNCDNLYSVSAFKALQAIDHPNAFINYDRAFLEYPRERIARFALTKVNTDQELLAIIEKPAPDDIDKYKAVDGTFRVSMNIWKFYGPLFYTYLQDCAVHPIRQEKELPSALLQMIQEHPGSMKAIPFAEHVPDLTGKDDIAIMNDYLSNHYSNLDWTT